MESVLHTLVIILFILIPGFIFRRVYYQGSFSKQFDSKSWSHSLFYSILFGIFIEIVAITIYVEFIKVIPGESVREFYTCISEHDLPIWIFNVDVLFSILIFLIILLSTSFLLAILCYLLVRLLKLDRRIQFLRFNNHWHYYFKGELKDFKEFSHIKGKFISAKVDALVNTEDGDNRLYTGFLTTYTICPNTGNLDTLYLTKPTRYDKKNSLWKIIPSDVLIIPYSRVINLNINYTFEVKKRLKIDDYIFIFFLIITIFIWFDFGNFLTKYGMISKILIKLIAQFILFSLLTLLLLKLSIRPNYKGNYKSSGNPKEEIKAFRFILVFFIIIELLLLYILKN